MDDIIKDIVYIDDVDSFVEKGLYTNNELSMKFYTLYKNYKILLEKYLCRKLSLKEYDDRIRDSGLLFIPVPQESMDGYQLLSTFNLDYIYLRSDLHVDKLSLAEIELLVNLSDDELNNPSDELFALIDRTYRSVIDSKKNGEDEIMMSCYGPDVDRFWFPSNELVFGLRYDEFADNGLGEDEEWNKNYNKQMQFIAQLISDLQQKCRDILGINVNFIYFDDNTCQKRRN